MMVKLEIGRGQVGIVEYLASQDIPLCAHLGLKPQSVHKLGGFKVQGREEEAAQRMVEDARALEERRRGRRCCSSACRTRSARRFATRVQIPVIGIGAGPGVDGQILVLYDVLGITQGRMPRFVKNYHAPAATRRSRRCAPTFAPSRTAAIRPRSTASLSERC